MRYFDDISFIHAAHLPQCDAHIDRTFDDLYGVMLIFARPIMLSLDHGPMREIVAPAVFWHEMGRHYQYRPVGRNWHHLWVSFRGTRADRLIKEGFNPVAPHIHAAALVEAEAAYKTMSELVKLVRNDLPHKHARAVHLLERMLLITLDNQQLSPTDTDARLMRLAQHIREEPALEYDFPTEAELLDLSYSHFRARFKKVLGAPPHDYLLQCRMSHAADMLQNDRYAIREVGEMLGYEDAAQFSKLFKNRYGYSPRRFREMGLR